MGFQLPFVVQRAFSKLRPKEKSCHKLSNKRLAEHLGCTSVIHTRTNHYFLSTNSMSQTLRPQSLSILASLRVSKPQSHRVSESQSQCLRIFLGKKNQFCPSVLCVNLSLLCLSKNVVLKFSNTERLNFTGMRR